MTREQKREIRNLLAELRDDTGVATNGVCEHLEIDVTTISHLVRGRYTEAYESDLIERIRQADKEIREEAELDTA